MLDSLIEIVPPHTQIDHDRIVAKEETAHDEHVSHGPF